MGWKTNPTVLMGLFIFMNAAKKAEGKKWLMHFSRFFAGGIL